ncbi:hypothetical protein BH20CHL7_BH20CHL7_14500 [soil metagenome]
MNEATKSFCRIFDRRQRDVVITVDRLGHGGEYGMHHDCRRAGLAAVTGPVFANLRKH